MSFKVGDWVTSKSWADTDRSPAQITNIEFATTPDEEHFVFLGDNYCIELEYIEKWVPKGVSPICGNSVGQDRRFLFNYMPELESYFHYRYLDVSTLKELARRWKPEILAGFSKKNTHQALDDIRESIAELVYYRETFIK